MIRSGSDVDTGRDCGVVGEVQVSSVCRCRTGSRSRPSVWEVYPSLDLSRRIYEGVAVVPVEEVLG